MNGSASAAAGSGDWRSTVERNCLRWATERARASVTPTVATTTVIRAETAGRGLKALTDCSRTWMSASTAAPAPSATAPSLARSRIAISRPYEPPL